MNSSKLEALKDQALRLREELEKECAKITEATAKTVEFLDTCEKLGLTVIGINKIPKNERDSWPFGAMGNAFGSGPKSKGGGSFEGWPAIWEAVDIHGVGYGCGNTNQHAISPDAKLIDGIYELRRGSWVKRS